MNEMATDRLHALVIPTQRDSILVPSVMTAEILNPPVLAPVPYAEPWVLGVAVWRRRAVPVVSFEVLSNSGPTPAPNRRAKLVVFHPLPGRSEWEFFAILASSDPQPYTVTQDLVLASATATPSVDPCIGARVKLGSSSVVIPDMDVIRARFYP